MTICIYALTPAELARRAMPRYQRQALAPFPQPREHGAPWGLNRLPQQFRDLTAEGWTQKLDVGQPLRPLPAAGAPALAPAPRPAAAPRGTPMACPERMSGTIWIDRLGATTGFPSNSWGPIPWPFEIVGCSVSTATASSVVNHWGLYLNDTHIEGAFATPVGEPLATSVFGPASDFVSSNGQRPYLMFSATGTTLTYAGGSPATQALGRTVHESGKHITLFIAEIAGQTHRLGINITVQRICEIIIEERYTARVVARPTVTAPRAPRAAIAAPRPPQPRISAHPTFGFTGAVWGPGAGNPTPWAGMQTTTGTFRF